MDPHCNFSSSLSCKLTIIRARNFDTIKSNSELFVRCYLSAGDNKRVKLETRKISLSNSDHFITWNQNFSLGCSGNQNSIKLLEQGSIIFELRSRRFNGSKLLGKSEILWETVMKSADMKIEKWVAMIPSNGRVHGDFKPPSVQVGMKIIQESLKARKANDDYECGCCLNDGEKYCCADYEFFAIGAALEETLL